MDGVVTTRYTFAQLAPKQSNYEVHSVSVKGASVNFKSEVLGDVVHAGGYSKRKGFGRQSPAIGSLGSNPKRS